MFFAIPLENKPTWRNPPWLTVLIILVNVVVFFGPQTREERAQEKATGFYMESVLPALEFAPFIRHVEKERPQDAALAKAAGLASPQTLLDMLQHDEAFLARLHREEIVGPRHAKFEEWHAARQRYEEMRPAAFTERWAKHYREPIQAHPETWITAAFLHADIGHLVGNMVFLFLFGFTVELSLGRAWYLGFYLLGAVGASLLSAWVYAGQPGYGLGASGAIAALMSMYAVLYRFRKINFFYSLFFYFNVVRAPAIALLPLWIANEVLQHFWSHSNVGYMAHLGGLLTGAALMMSFRATRTAQVATEAPSSEQNFQARVDEATALSSSMKLEQACRAWGRAVRMQPDNLMAVEKFFNTAALWPDKPAFHLAAAAAFRLKTDAPQVLAFQHQAFKTYFDKARPHARLTAQDMARLCKRFARAGFMDDAAKLCRALCAADPDHPEAVDLVCVCANAALRANQTQTALGWLPILQQRAPQHPTTQRLQELSAP